MLPLVVAVSIFSNADGFCQSVDSQSVASASAVQAAEQEVVRRQGVMREAEALLHEGDLLYSKGQLGEAVDQYRMAVTSLNQTSMEKAFRGVALSKYEKAATEYGEQLVKEGRFNEAMRVTDDLFDSEVGSDYRPATRLEGRLDDPQYYNPALSPDHVARAGKVEELLSKGFGFIELGDYDGASATFAEVLAYDRYNSGARRGLEMVDQLVTKYEEAAYDHTRAKMLREIAAEWETQVQPLGQVGVSEFRPIDDGEGGRGTSLSKKLKTIIVPAVSLNGARIDDVLEFLTARSRDLDTLEPDPSKKGVNFILNLGDGVASPTTRPVTLELRGVPLERVLQYATEQAGLKYKIDAFAVSVIPLTADAGSLITEKFRVPPDFLRGGSMGGGAGSADPFAAPEPSGGGGLTKKLTAREFLEKSGVEFGPGASVAYSPDAGMLVVRNTPTNLEFVEALVAGFRSDVPRQIVITTRVIDTTETRLEELGVSWLLAGFSIGANGGPISIGGGTTGNVRSSGTFSSNTVSDFPVGVTPGFEGSGGLRTGAVAQPSDGIASALAASAVGNVVGVAGRAAQLAPAIFAVTGIAGSPNFEVVLRGLSQQKGIDLLTAPSTVVRSGQRSEIKVVREFIYPTEYDPPDIPNNIGSNGSNAFPVTPANPTAFETREIGTTLEVEPIIGPDNFTIELNLAPEVSDFIGFVNYGSPITARVPGGGFFPGDLFLNALTDVFTLVAPGTPGPVGSDLIQQTLPVRGSELVVLTQNRIVMPIFKTVRATSSVSIYDGQTVVLGGLLENRKRDVKDKVPLMGDLPVVGRFFRSTSVRNEKRAIVIFVSVRILDPSGSPLNEI